ncbi:hypothetical protein D3C74_71520 [compost metagenome]
MNQGNSTLRKLNKDYKSKGMETLVQLNPYEGMGHYAFHYRHCADRLVNSHRANPEDDEILMPFLSLYRQAYELMLKDLALCVASHQRRFGNPSSYYSKQAMETRIGTGKDNFGHKIIRSFSWVESELKILGLVDSNLPPELLKAVDLLHGIDPSGTNFRYPDPQLTEPLNVDIYKLQSVLATGFEWLSGVYDYVDETLGAAPSASEFM